MNYLQIGLTSNNPFTNIFMDFMIKNYKEKMNRS